MNACSYYEKFVDLRMISNQWAAISQLLTV